MSSVVNTPDADRVIFAEHYGVSGNGVSDDREALQDALDAAETLASSIGGQVTVKLPAGRVVLVVPTQFISTAPSASTRYGCVAMPSHVVLDLCGSVLKADSTAGDTVNGAVIFPKGLPTNTSSYGAASGWSVRNGTINVTDSSKERTGNLLVFAQCENVVWENLRLGACKYHQCEVQSGRNLLVRDVLVTAAASVGNAEIQLDVGGDAAICKNANFTPTAAIENIAFINVRIPDYAPGGASAARRIEFGHSTGVYKDVLFEKCYFAGYPKDGASDGNILDFNATVAGVVVERLRLTGCTFDHNAMGGNSACFASDDTSNVTIRDITVENCRFVGSYRYGVRIGASSVSTATSGNYALKRGIRIRNNHFAPSQAAQAPGQTGTTRVISVQGAEDAVISGNFELSPATETNLTSNAYTSIASLNNKRCHILNNTIVRQQASLAAMANGDNNGFYIRVDNVLALSGTQEVVYDLVGNSITGIHRVGLYESADPGATWAAGGYTRIRGLRDRNLFHTAGTVANQIFINTGVWAAPAGTLLTGAATTDSAAEGLYAADGRAVSTLTNLAKHVATALYGGGGSIPLSVGQRVVLTPRTNL
jgi:hypothetical protein